jgi:hydroxyethylthiazole kinase
MTDASDFIQTHYQPVQAPLVDCITNRVTIETMANSLIAIGAAPIMADYEPELADIFASCQAVLLNMGQLSTGAIKALTTALKLARQLALPSVLDLVGFGASQTRRELGWQLAAGEPTIIKGNASELRAFAGLAQSGQGVDASTADQTTAAMQELITALQPQAQESVFLLTGQRDLIISRERTWMLTNDAPELARLTGMGDVVGAFAAAFASNNTPEVAAMAAVSCLNVSAQKARAANPAAGLGTFKAQLQDQLGRIGTDWISAVEGQQWVNQ